MPPNEPSVPADVVEGPGPASEAERDRWNGPRTFHPVESNHLAWYVRVFLVVVMLGLISIFAMAAWIRPYADDGTAQTMETHTQLGLPKCNMVQAAGKPCPACGMTTSFSLLMHGDLKASLKANWVGTLLAIFWLSLIPWAAFSAVRGRYLFIRSAETLMTVAVSTLLVLMIGRWAYIWFG